MPIFLVAKLLEETWIKIQNNAKDKTQDFHINWLVEKHFSFQPKCFTLTLVCDSVIELLVVFYDEDTKGLPNPITAVTLALKPLFVFFVLFFKSLFTTRVDKLFA